MYQGSVRFVFRMGKSSTVVLEMYQGSVRFVFRMENSQVLWYKRCIREVLGFSSGWEIVKYCGIRDVSGKR